MSRLSRKARAAADALDHSPTPGPRRPFPLGVRPGTETRLGSVIRCPRLRNAEAVRRIPGRQEVRRRLAKLGSSARMRSTRSNARSATTIPTPSTACATTVPHGSTTMLCP